MQWMRDGQAQPYSTETCVFASGDSDVRRPACQALPMKSPDKIKKSPARLGRAFTLGNNVVKRRVTQKPS